MFYYLAIATFAIGSMAAAPKTPEWESSYGKALEATQETDEPLLVVLDKPKSKSARLAPELLSEDLGDEADNRLLRPYQLCHIDVTTKYGRKVARAFKATTFPHVSIIDKTGSTVIFRKSGKIEAEEWQRILSRHKSGDKSLAKSVSRTSYKLSGESSSDSLRPSCPNCQRNSF